MNWRGPIHPTGRVESQTEARHPARRNRASLWRRSWKRRLSSIHCLAYDIWITFRSRQRLVHHITSHKYAPERPTSFVRCSTFNQGQSFLILAWLNPPVTINRERFMVGKQKAFSGEQKKILLPQRGSSTSCERFQAVQKENPYLCL